ncbi:MAG: sporulation protein YtfJ [Oscillospiraceae bacterium]|nr:sporulation protein YtfJ [Oscillospiraceae bacterium]
MAETNLSKMIETALENLKKMTDTNTVVGEPIKLPGGGTVIPVSKVSVGFASGGMDYSSKAAPEKAPNFGGGTGSGFTITPIAFLVVDESGAVNLLNLSATAAPESKDLIGTISGLVDKAPSMVEKITKMFKKEKEPAAGEQPEAAPLPEAGAGGDGE